MFKRIPLLILIVAALTAVTCYGFHRLTPSAPCDPKEITLITGFWVLIMAVMAGIYHLIRERRRKENATPDH
jgi:hypothetical protein